MSGLAFLFAGQGAQKPGMGQSLYQGSRAAKEVFDTMESVRPGTLADCFEASPERLSRTDVTQPCVYAVDLAAAAALAEAGVVPKGAAGFSLGEVAALAFAGAFEAKMAAELLCQRALLMQQAAEVHPGAMAAVLKLEDTQVEALCSRYDGMWPVNYNCPGQLVVAGVQAELPDFCAAVKEMGGLAKPLAVGGAFHTPLMADAAVALASYLEGCEMRLPEIPVYANFNAQPYQEPMKVALASQMENPVRWVDSIRRMAQDGFDTFVEVGPGKTLSGFVKRILPEAIVLNVQDMKSLQATLNCLK